MFIRVMDREIGNEFLLLLWNVYLEIIRNVLFLLAGGSAAGFVAL